MKTSNRSRPCSGPLLVDPHTHSALPTPPNSASASPIDFSDKPPAWPVPSIHHPSPERSTYPPPVADAVARYRVSKHRRHSNAHFLRTRIGRNSGAAQVRLGLARAATLETAEPLNEAFNHDYDWASLAAAEVKFLRLSEPRYFDMPSTRGLDEAVETALGTDVAVALHVVAQPFCRSLDVEQRLQLVHELTAADARPEQADGPDALLKDIVRVMKI